YGTPRDAGVAEFMGEANLIEGTLAAHGVDTPLGRLETNGGTHGSVGSPAWVMVRPEQLLIGPADQTGSGADGVDGIVQSYEYFGHDAVVRVRPELAALPPLIVRITGGEPIAPGTRVSLQVRGAVVAWSDAQ
ncbi:MAG TPA: TOBE domain-containing protein, partial [Acidimicrobiales bacterium]